MSFSDLVTEVVEITKRPDLVAKTNRAVSSATLAVHNKALFKSDLVEIRITFPEADYEQTINKWDALPNFRRIESIFAPNELTQVSPGDVVDSYNSFRTDVYYEAGAGIQIKSSTPITSAYLLYYANPTVTPDANYSSWIANWNSRIIVTYAAAQLCRDQGWEEKAKELTTEFNSLFNSLVQMEVIRP